MEEIAYAKINLALHVRERSADGYHRIETIFAFADDGDRLTAELDDDLTLALEGPFARGLSNDEDNLVLRAATALRDCFAIGAGARLSLDKRLPIASGIGGGSADAAAALRLLDRLWQCDAGDDTLIEIAVTLGADVPACVRSVAVRGEGRGDLLIPAGDNDLSGLPLLLVNPLVAVPTGPVFQGWDGVDRGPLAGDVSLAAAIEGRNDLQVPANMIAPVIADILIHLNASHGLLLARMSGSGATCFGLFETDEDRDAAAEAVRKARPDWWQFAGRLR